MNFKKLALASAIAAMPMSAFALDEIADEALSDVSGQDGISAVLNISTAGINTDIYLHDKDGLNTNFGSGTSFSGSSVYSFDGAIVIDNMSIAAGSGGNITISIDAGDRTTSYSGAATGPILNVNIGLPNTLTIVTGNIFVGNSQRDNSAWSVDGMSSTILNSMSIILGGTQLNIQLGNEAQGGTMSTAGCDMMVLTSSITNGLIISNFRLNDATGSGDGGIAASTITVLDNGGTNLTLGLDINATDAGLVVGFGQFGHATNGADIRIVDQYLGTSTNSKIGDISIVGLNLNNSTLTINGK